MLEGLISIVLPIYNVEMFLERCLNSVTCQTYGNLEIILVDDGSTDKCPEICDHWEAKDPRIKVIHKKNAGLGMARNSGIECASGEYICFFDSDDYIVPDAIEKIYFSINKEKADIAIFGYKNITKEGKVESIVVPQTDRAVYSGAEIQEELLADLISPDFHKGTESNLCISAWTAMYSMKLIHETRWRFASEREMIAEDVYSHLLLYRYIRKAVIISEAFYCYCENQASLTHKYREDRYLQIVKFYNQCLKTSAELGYNETIMERLVWPYFSFTIAAMKQVVTADKPFAQRIRQLKEIVGDSTLQKALRIVRKQKLSLQRQVLFSFLRNKMTFASFALLFYKVKK